MTTFPQKEIQDRFENTEQLTIPEALAYLRERFGSVSVDYMHGEGGRVMGCTFKVDRSKHHVFGAKASTSSLRLYADCVEYSRRKAKARLERKRRALVERERRMVADWVAQARPDR